jgi:aspartyl-tRNA synthetase
MDDRTLALVRAFTKWGTFSSIAALDSKYLIFTSENIEGCIGYQVHHGKAVITGSPLCPPEAIPHIMEAFLLFCQENGWKCVCTAAAGPFAEWAFQNCYPNRIETTDEFVLDPFAEPTKGSKGRSLRNKINLAQKAGITIHEYCGEDPLFEEKLEECAKGWLSGRRGPQIHLMKAELFGLRLGRRWFYAQKGDDIIAVTFIQKAEAHGGWILPMLMPLQTAPKGCSEFLVFRILEQLKKEECRALVIGATQKDKVGEMVGTYFFSRLFIRFLFNTSAHLFGLGKRRHFWKKFRPEKAPSYLMFENSRVSYREMLAIFKTLNTTIGPSRPSQDPQQE